MEISYVWYVLNLKQALAYGCVLFVKIVNYISQAGISAPKIDHHRSVTFHDYM